MFLQARGSSLALDVDESRATLLHSGEPVRSWPAVAVESLSADRAVALAPDGPLVFIERASPRALALLREVGVSYATSAGEWHLVDPPDIFVVKPADRPQSVVEPSPDRPLGKGAARIARWLLLHPENAPVTITDLARSAQVSEATSSRGVRHLAERDLVSAAPAADGRHRHVTVRDRSALLDVLADETPWRRARRTTWDVGVGSVDETLALIRREAAGFDRYAIGELAGAAFVRRLVEPSMVVLWLPAHDLPAWQDALLAQPARPAPARVIVRLAPDPVVLDWGARIDGLRVADPVQLYIDCRHAGERAIDAAEALRERVLRS